MAFSFFEYTSLWTLACNSEQGLYLLHVKNCLSLSYPSSPTPVNSERDVSRHISREIVKHHMSPFTQNDHRFLVPGLTNTWKATGVKLVYDFLGRIFPCAQTKPLRSRRLLSVFFTPTFSFFSAPAETWPPVSGWINGFVSSENNNLKCMRRAQAAAKLSAVNWISHMRLCAMDGPFY